jgi:hypothetical protein
MSTSTNNDNEIDEMTNKLWDILSNATDHEQTWGQMMWVWEHSGNIWRLMDTIERHMRAMGGNKYRENLEELRAEVMNLVIHTRQNSYYGNFSNLVRTEGKTVEMDEYWSDHFQYYNPALCDLYHELKYIQRGDLDDDDYIGVVPLELYFTFDDLCAFLQGHLPFNMISQSDIETEIDSDSEEEDYDW